MFPLLFDTRERMRAVCLMYCIVRRSPLNSDLLGSVSVSRDEVIQMKPFSRTNGGQPFSSPVRSSPSPSSPSHPAGLSSRPATALHPGSPLTQSPAHKPQGGGGGIGVKKVTGVGGTTYEISV